MLAGALYVGTLVGPRQVYLGYVPVETHGILVRAIHLCVGKNTTVSPINYYILQVGIVEGSRLGTAPSGKFHSLADIPFIKGITTDGLRWEFTAPLSVPRGSVMALKALLRGQPVPVKDLAVALEYGLSGQR